MSTLPSSYVPDKVLAFIDELVWCPDSYKRFMTMALAVSHNRGAFTTVPYPLATGDKPHSGKSTLTADIPMLLAYAPEMIDRTTTRDALNNMYIGRTTPNGIWDDIGKIFGFEFGFQQTFDFLPKPLDGLGVSANYTILHSDGVPQSTLSSTDPDVGAGRVTKIVK